MSQSSVTACEVYRYAMPGARVLKSSRHGQVRYLSGLEIRTTRSDGRTTESLRVVVAQGGHPLTRHEQ